MISLLNGKLFRVELNSCWKAGWSVFEENKLNILAMIDPIFILILDGLDFADEVERSGYIICKAQCTMK